MSGYQAPNSPTAVTLTNGIIKLTSGSTTDQTRFNLSFYDNGSYVSSREIAINYGSSKTGMEAVENSSDSEERTSRMCSAFCYLFR